MSDNIAYEVTVYPRDDRETVKFTTSSLSFVNSESYGPPKNFGITPLSTDTTLVNLANALVVEVEVVDE